MNPIKINIILFGIGNLGSSIINQVIEKQQELLDEKNIEIRFPVITNSTLAFFESEDKKNKWNADFTKSPAPFAIQNIIDYALDEALENLIAIDATTSSEILNSYTALIENGFNILAFNTNASNQQSAFYKEINTQLKKSDKKFLYPRRTNKITPTHLLNHIFKAISFTAIQQRQAS